MEDRISNAVNFYLLATKLKYMIRSGWDENHWNINKDRIESIAEHIYGTCILAISIDSEFEFNIDLNKVIKMLVIHELGEVLIGDITPFDNISKQEKLEIEHRAFNKIVGSLVKRDELISLMKEFDEHKTKESIFAYYCDKLEANLQSKVYQDTECHNDLNNQENNIAFTFDRIKKILNEGATTPFDVWYESDKYIFKDNEVFSKILKYIKDNNTNI